MSTIITRSLRLQKPLTRDSVQLPKGKSPEFWKQLRVSGIVFVGTVLVSYLWDLFNLPEFGAPGNRHQWIFPLMVVGVLFSVQNSFEAFREERSRRQKRKVQAEVEAFEAEVFPFLREELGKIELHRGYPNDLPFAQFTADRMLNGDGMEWAARYGDTRSEQQAGFRATLENEGRDVLLWAEIPDQIDKVSLQKGV